MAQQLEVKDGDVIWMSVGLGFPKWPCKVNSLMILDLLMYIL